MVKLHLYPSLENNNSVVMGTFACLKDAWHEVYRITAITKYNVRDFFTTEQERETNY